MADLLLTHGYFLAEDEKEQRIMKPYPPLGLMYLSAYLKRAGFTVDIYDSTLGTRAELFARLAAGPAGVLGVYTNLMTRGAVLAITQHAKAHGWSVILGGSESANYPLEFLEHGADAVVVGEGEETLVELLPALSERGPHRLHGIAGVKFKDEDGRLVENAPRPLISDLDSLPWPDRAQMDIREYMRIWRERHGMGSVHMITARGCPYGCKWCSRAVFGSTHRRRSVQDCADELETIQRTYHPEQVWYADDVFTINHPWLFEYAAELDRRDLRLPFETISRADRLMSEDVMATLAAMGCYRLWIGSESGSQRVLDAMDRRVTIDQVRWATKAAQRHGMQVGMFLMWGYEGETLEDIEATVEHVKRTGPDIFVTTICYPVRDTDYYQAVEDRLRQPKAWVDSTDRELLVAGRHSRDFYGHATRWLRSDVEASRLEASAPDQASGKRSEAADARRAMLAAAHEVEA
jgi:radical SAM superfamily enzyme YgiQ (UPF0313 family)